MIILASGSERRSSILLSCGIKHRVVKSNVQEIMTGKSPAKLVVRNAVLKAEAVFNDSKIKSGCIIGADTVVFFDKKIVGKPRDAKHAKGMLREMSGKRVFVYTGLCVIDAAKDRKTSGYQKSDIKVKKLAEKDIRRYFKLLGPYDKAGGFSIEGVGSFIFDDIKGSYFNILGLPMAKLKDLFSNIGIDILTAVS